MSWIEYTSYKHYPSGELKHINYECSLNKNIRERDGINTAWKYRDYLQSNSNKIINYNTKNSLTQPNPNVLNIVNRGFSYTLKQSDMKQDYLKRTKTVSCPSIPMF